MRDTFPRSLEVTALEPYRLRVRWSTGETLDVDLAAKLKGVPALAHVLKPTVFAKAHAGEHGVCIEWEDSEFGADNVYAWSREQAGQPSHEMFNAWMLRNRLSLSTAAAALGLSRRMAVYYRTGARPLPRLVWLACLGWETQRPGRKDRAKAA